MLDRRIWIALISAAILTAGLMVVFLKKPEVGEPTTTVVYTESKNEGIVIPDSVSFAGEPIPLEYFDVRENLERELLVNSYFHSQTIRFIKLAPRYFSIIEPILKKNGIPDDFKFLAVAESNLDPKAVSPAKAVGMWQFLEGTAKEYGLEINNEIDERYHVEKSTSAACDYLKKAYEKFGSWTLVASAYNAGRAYTLTQMEKQNISNYFDLLLGEETERYVFRILALKLVLEHPENYGFNIPDDKKYPVIPTRDIEVKGPVISFADFAKANGTNYKLLKMFNPWLRGPDLTNKYRKTYVIKVPVENARVFKKANQDK
jgi:hypothetical protein